jgi:uncharacterized membrane protein YphA (DoxX/SURF4 family)
MSTVLDVVATAVQVGIGFIFVAAGSGKLTRWHEFKGTLDAYRLLPASVVRPAAAFIVVAELVGGLALVSGWQAEPCALLASVMLACFAAGMAINLARGRSFIDCGCFQGARQPIEWRLVVRNVVLALAAFGSSNYSMAGDDPQRWVQAVPAGVAVAVLYFSLGAVWALDTSRAAAFKRS